MARFNVLTTSGFSRDLKKLFKTHRITISLYEEVILTLEEDPYDIARKHDIKKLGGIKHGEGQFRVRIGHWRIRYDIENDIVILYSFKDRKEGY